MKTFFATFGTGQAYAGCYVEIIAEDHHAASLFMMTNHGPKWSGDVYAAEMAQKAIVFDLRLRRLATVRQKLGDQHKDGSLVFNVVKEAA